MAEETTRTGTEERPLDPELVAWINDESVTGSPFFREVVERYAMEPLNDVSRAAIIAAVKVREEHVRLSTPEEPAADDLETASAPADGKWVFDENVTRAFDDMLARSIPQYQVMRRGVTDLACRYAPRGKVKGAVFVDLGASRGEALAPLVDRYGVHGDYHAVEVADPMRAALAARFADESHVRIHDTDLREGYPPVPPADVTLCVLTLMFTPIQYRQRILWNVFERTKPGGALILVEKVLGETAKLDEDFVQLYHRLKGENGYSPEAIERKRLSLEGVQVPVTAKWNEDLLRQAGFRQIDCFWRWMNFAGWIAVK